MHAKKRVECNGFEEKAGLKDRNNYFLSVSIH